MKLLGGGSSKVDTSAIDKQNTLIAKQNETLAANEAQQASDAERKKKASARARNGRTSLIYGSETGVQPTQDGLRTELG